LNEIREKHRIIGDIRGVGLMIGIELVRDERKTPAAEESRRIKKLMLEEGVLVGVGGVYGNVVRIQPPLIISYDELDLIVEALDRSLSMLSR
ncbi:MAG: aminotransferase class III-fold pyridoxal phosphate-dependent enzyme, partial [Sulfolobales archaeon]